MSSSKASVGATERGEAEFSVVRRRASPRIVLLDESFAIAFAEWDAVADLVGIPSDELERHKRLPESIERAVSALTATWPSSGEVPELVALISDKTALRISRLSGSQGRFIALQLEEAYRHEDFSRSIERYRLTRRELDVITLLLQGLGADEIAQKLCISGTTVTDYVKKLLRKTRAKNRADMLAKLLGWTTSKTDATQS